MKAIPVPHALKNILLAVVVWFITNTLAHSATILWTNTLGGNWNVPANWSPNQVPGAADNANITADGTYAVTVNVNSSVNNLILGGAASGLQTVQANGFTLGTITASVNNGGVLALTNSTFTGALTIASAGLIKINAVTLNAQVTVQGGGEFLASGTATLSQAGQAGNTNNWLWVQSGGLLDAAASGSVALYSVLTNAGTLNLTNNGITILNNGSSGYNGGVINQAGGIINLISSAGITGNYGFDYLVNQGAINVTNGSSTISVNNVTNLGTVATLPGAGTLRIGTFNGLGSLTGTYNAAAGTIIQFVAGTSPGTSQGIPLTLGGAGQYQFFSGLLTLPLNVIPGLTAMTGGSLLLGPGFQGGSISNLALDGINLTNTLALVGTLAATNGSITGTIVVSNGAVLNVNGTTLNAQVTVQGGGEFLASGTATLSQAGQAGNTNKWLWVQSGGLLDASASGPLNLYSVLTNAGTMNLTNNVNIYNNGSSGYNGGVINQAGGIINLINAAGITGNYGFDYLVNQGTINVTNGSSTISINNLSNPGIVATLPGTASLRIGTFNGPGSLAGNYNAAAGTIIQFVAGTSPGTSQGIPLTLGGAGQYQFVSGVLTLPLNLVPGLTAMTGGSLVLGTGFQGGTITNLTLDGISLTNTLPLTGTLTTTNGTVYDSIVVSNKALLNVNGTTLNAQVTVENGGEFLASGTATLSQAGQAGNTNNWLWVQSGGLLDASVGATLSLYSVLTNAGTMNVTNSNITIFNNGSSGYNGGVVNQAGGIINLISAAGITGNYGFDYLVNQGTINVTNGSSTISINNLTNQAILNAGLWAVQLQNSHVNLGPSGTLHIAVAGPSTFGQFNLNGSVALNGTFGLQLNNGFIPLAGTSYPVFSYGSFSGNFTSFSYPNTPPVIAWQPVYSGTKLTLVAQPAMGLLLSGTNVTANLNGVPGHQAILLTSTNLTGPVTSWTPVATNTFDATCYLSFTNNVNLNYSRQFFTFKLQ
jgi:hypothetical protein